MSILDRLQRTDAAMKNAAVSDQLGLLLKQHAIKAMMAGIGKPDWEKYMSLFAENKEQLIRLTVPKDGEEEWLPESRAYMIANAICGADSTTQTSVRVNGSIAVNPNGDPNSDIPVVDPNVNPIPPGAIVRPFFIP